MDPPIFKSFSCACACACVCMSPAQYEGSQFFFNNKTCSSQLMKNGYSNLRNQCLLAEETEETKTVLKKTKLCIQCQGE